MRNSMECYVCGGELKKVSKKNYRKWEIGDLYFICKECEKNENKSDKIKKVK